MQDEIKVPIINREKPVTTSLADQDRRALLAITQMPGYGVLLKLMEMRCVLQDIALGAVDAEDERKVLAEHRIAKGYWGFFVGLQKQVHQEINALINDGNDRLAKAERASVKEHDAILDATVKEEEE